MDNTSERPYCDNCGYSLEGLTESAKCPECGKPIVEVLMRDSFRGQKGYRYESETKFAGLPLVAIASGPHQGERIGRAVGIVAIGDAPKGVIAIGGFPLGAIAIGGVPRGVLSIGGACFGVFAVGGAAIGGVSLGGIAIGLYAFGGLGITFLGGMAGTLIRLL